MSVAPIRIISDLHFGDRSSRVRRLGQLRPLLDGAAHLVLNGDTLDTRPGPAPERTAALRHEIADFFSREIPAATFLTGNHDADISPHHALDLAHGAVFAVHGDILFDTIVPWSRDVPLIRRLLAAELAALPPGRRADLEARLAVWRRVAGRIPRRHEGGRQPLKVLLHLFADTVWPPWRALRILRAWRVEPRRAAALLREHRPRARFIVLGHTHRPGMWRMPDGIVVINTGSFGLPLGGHLVEIGSDRLRIRRIVTRHAEFHCGDTLAEFSLPAGTAPPATASCADVT